MNAGLVDLGVQATDLTQEGERYALALRAALRKVEREFGDGYLNSVFVDLLDDSELCKNGEVAEVRQHVCVAPPEPSRSYRRCRELIADEISRRAVELRDKLKYSPEETKQIMTKALATYLDERFSVSSRRQLGML